MLRESRKYLHDIQQAAMLIKEFSAGKGFSDYERDAMLRAAVEREFTIIEEAMTQLAIRDEALASRISNYRRVIAFRNVLVHGYTAVDDRLVWDVLQGDLPTLADEVDALLADNRPAD